MRIYILVADDKNGEPTFEMPVRLGRKLRVYESKKVAQRYAAKFNCTAIELKVEEGYAV